MMWSEGMNPISSWAPKVRLLRFSGPGPLTKILDAHALLIVAGCLGYFHGKINCPTFCDDLNNGRFHWCKVNSTNFNIFDL